MSEMDRELALQIDMFHLGEGTNVRKVAENLDMAHLLRGRVASVADLLLKEALRVIYNPTFL